ncbi:MAG: DUF3352 domain-containing protein [Candidatus Promineifilaceae bacterium]
MQNRLTTLVGFIIGLGLVAGGAFAYVSTNGTATTVPTSQISAEAMPPETLFYATVDVFNLLDPVKLARVARTFAPVYAQANILASDDDEAIAAIDSQFEALGLTFRGDIQPWIGRSVGAGILDFELRDEELLPTEFVVAAEIRNQTLADAFLTKLIANYPAAYNGQPLTQQPFGDITILVDGSPTPPFAISRSDSLMLIASDANVLQRAIGAQAGSSLFSNFGYTEAVAKLPAERPITTYVAGPAFARLIRDFSDTLDTIGLTDAMLLEAQTRLAQLESSLDERGIGALAGVAASLSLGDDGLQLDAAAAYDSALVSAEQLIRLQQEPPPMQANRMPQDSFLYLSGGGLATLWEYNRNLLLGVDNNDDAEDAMTLAEQQMGFDVERDLIAQLDGGLAIGAYPASDGLLAMMNATQMGLVVTQGIADGAQLEQPIEQVGTALSSMLGVPIAKTGDHYSIALLGADLAAYGVRNGAFVFTTHAENLDQPAQILTGSAEFQQALLAIPANMTLTGWVDLNGLITSLNLEPPEALQNIPMAAWGMGNTQGGGTMRVILFFDE